MAVVLDGDTGARASDAELGRTPGPVGELGHAVYAPPGDPLPLVAGEAGAVVATLNGRELTVASYLEDHVSRCSRPRRPPDRGHVAVPLQGRAGHMAAIAAVDAALWDTSTARPRVCRCTSS